MNMLYRPRQAITQHRLRVTMLGLRGFPDVQGGVEKHVENLSVRLAELGCDVEAIVRSPYMSGKGGRIWQDVTLHPIWSPRIQGVETFVHTFLGVLHAARTRPDVLHIHAIGPAFFTPLARLAGLRVVVTHHSVNYHYEKWNRLGRTILRLGERAGMVLAQGRIAVSHGLAAHVRGAYAVDVAVIPNGIGRPPEMRSTAALEAFGLVPRRYVLHVGRLDPEKCQADLIAAFARARRPDWKLAIAGGAEYSDAYSAAVKGAAENTAGVVMLGHQTGTALAELYAHAGVFVMPSRREGQPIAVLEAISYGCPVLLSDIPAHREIGAAAAQYFTVGDVAGLAERLSAAFDHPPDRAATAADRERILQAHDWRRIAEQTLDVYLAVRSRRFGAASAVPAKAHRG
jgi:glycosyltransferase involved in cell wall biosynthesis